MSAPASADIGLHAMARARWHWGEAAFWLLALSAIWLFPNRYLILTEIAWLALFALSLDLILGYAGIVTLGHAAFFGIGAYTAGLLAKYGWGEPLSGLLCAAVVAANGVSASRRSTARA